MLLVSHGARQPQEAETPDVAPAPAEGEATPSTLESPMPADQSGDEPAGQEAPESSSERTDSFAVTPAEPNAAPPPRQPERTAVPYAPGMRPAVGLGGPARGESASRTHPARVERRESPLPVTRTPRGDADDGEEWAGPRADVRGEVGSLIDSLRALFEQDRAIASQSGTTRCGICYLHFPASTLTYREDEGYYVCERCARDLRSSTLPMVRRQQRL
jgi:hypothetical protein